jgi:hypothetical protein
MNDSFDAGDLDLLRDAGITPEKASDQLTLLRGGMNCPRLLRPCTVGDGIELPDPSLFEELGKEYQEACAEGRWVHFIPASGAATRLAESLGELGASGGSKEGDEGSARLRALLGDPESLRRLPKALMPFHEVAGTVRTPVEEHIREAAALAPGAEARLHFTIAPEHEERFLREVETVLDSLRREGIRAEVSHSFQDPATQTLALDERGEPFRDESGRLVLRPGGHGSLLRNLESCGAEFAWIRNIDNIPVDRLRAEGRALRRALGGLLMRRARSQNSGPVRLCGMVANTGEPGGGPFWVQSAGDPTVRIVESAEVDPADAEQQRLFRSGTHFNPVDLAVALRDASGKPYALEDFSDPAACFIASKKHGGRALRALEWPGLWNGAMAKWETHCVEIPLAQFAPVKTVTDLLRPEHQA